MASRALTKVRRAETVVVGSLIVSKFEITLFGVTKWLYGDWQDRWSEFMKRVIGLEHPTQLYVYDRRDGCSQSLRLLCGCSV